MKKKKLIIVLQFLLLLISSCSNEEFKKLEVTKCRYKITSEQNLLDKKYLSSIDSLYNKGVDGYLRGKNNIKIYYKYFLQNPIEKEKGAILISNGRTEAVVKYKEIIYDLYNNGYSVYIHDHRGQGFSGRMVKDSDMGFVDNFRNYIDDMKVFYDSILTKENHENIFLLAHSMGGAIGVTYIEQYPHDFKAVALSSPMLGLPFPTCEVIGLIAGDKPEYAMGHTNYINGIEPFAENTLTNSEIRYKRMLDVFNEFPKARLGGASYQWVYKSCKAFSSIVKNLNKIETPLILFSGEEEEVVDPSSHVDFIMFLKNNGQSAKGYLVENAKHELLIEKDSARRKVLCKIFDFFNEHG